MEALGISKSKGTEMNQQSGKKKTTAALLCFFLGGAGFHRFYVGKVGTGILTIVTFFGFCGIWPLVDFIQILRGRFTDKLGNLVTA